MLNSIWLIFWRINKFILNILILTFCFIDKRYHNNAFHLVNSKISNSNNNYNKLLISALILAEDRRYLLHSGVDTIAIVRVILLYITKGKLRGASTIEQQFVRTITNDRSYTLLRKIREQRLAIVLGGYANKETIINSYLNIAYFGWKMNGITSACFRLGYDINSLNIDQISHLIAMLKYPMPRIPSLQRLKQIERRKVFIKSCLLCQTG